MRAMAILYIGPHRNPDFQSDYQLSPILAPDRLLAQFPPLLMTCGEKDPFVDDTLIFAGRVREAKRARRAELERIIAGKSSQFGEALRMSNYDVGHGHDGSQSLRALRRERERLAAETEEDWVQMHIFSEWSHGYLQMPTLMREVRGVLDDLADWMDVVFAKQDRRAASPGADRAQRERAGIPASISGDPRGMSNGSPPRPHGTKLAVRRLSKTAYSTGDDDTDGLPSSTTASETELDTDEVLSFAPKRRSPPSSLTSFRRDSSGSAGTARRPSMGHSASMPTPPPAANGDLRRSAMLHDIPTPSGRDAAADPVPSSTSSSPPPGSGIGGSPSVRRPGSQTPGSNAPTPTKGGQTISESELMRRRRLLDAHLISSQSQDSVK